MVVRNSNPTLSLQLRCSAFEMSQDELNLLAGASGIRIGPIANEQTGGGGTWGGTMWLKGSMVVTTLEGKQVGTLYVNSANLEYGQLDCGLVLPDGRVFAQILRNAATNFLRWDNGPSTIRVMGKNRAICDASKTGGYRLEGYPGVGLMYNQPCCQPKCQWCLFSFCCFFPTAGIAACYGLYKTDQAPSQYDVSVVGGQSLQTPVNVLLEVHSKQTVCDFGDTGVGPEVKLDLMMFAAMKSVDNFLNESFQAQLPAG